MTTSPQDDLTAERAASIVGIIDGLAYIDPNDHRKCEKAIRSIIQQIRQEALREYREAIAYKLQLDHSNHPTRFRASIIEALDEADRLASEGAPSPIDLSSKFNDDGGYGEHF